MLDITLVCTVYKAQGNCNPFELYKIIEHLAPSVIFEELSEENFRSFYVEQKRTNLETDAIKMHLMNHVVKQIPVDTYDLPVYYHELLDRVYNRVTGNNMISECRALQNAFEDNGSLIARHGFNYLNSTFIMKE